MSHIEGHQNTYFAVVGKFNQNPFFPRLEEPEREQMSSVLLNRCVYSCLLNNKIKDRRF